MTTKRYRVKLTAEAREELKVLGVGESTVARVRRRCVEEGLEADNPYIIKNHTLISGMIHQNSNK